MLAISHGSNVQPASAELLVTVVRNLEIPTYQVVGHSPSDKIRGASNNHRFVIGSIDYGDRINLDQVLGLC